MEIERVVVGHRRMLHPTAKQADLLELHAAYAESVRRWVEDQDECGSVKKLYTAFKASALFDKALSGTVANRAIAGVVDKVAIGDGRLFDAADADRHGSKHVKVESVAHVRRRLEVIRDAHQRLRLPKVGGVQIVGDWLPMEGRSIRNAWIGCEDDGVWWVDLVVSARVLVRTCKARMRATKGQRAALSALARRVDAVWNGVGVVVWAAGVKVKGKDAATREALQAQLEACLAGQPDAVCTSARAVWGEARERPYADTKMVKGWSKDAALAVAGGDYRLQQAVIVEVAAQYKTSQDLKLGRAQDRQRKRAVQRKRDAEIKAGRRFAAAYAKTGEIDRGFLERLAGAQKSRPKPHAPKPGDYVLTERDSAPEIRCPASGCGAVFPRTRARCPECGHGRQPEAIGGAGAWSTTRKTGWIPLRDTAQGAYALEWEGGAFVVRLKHLGGLSIPLDEPERLAGRSVRSATVTEDAKGLWYLSVACEELTYRPAAYSAPIGVNTGLREMVTSSRGEKFIMPRYRARDLELYRKLQGARDGKARKAGRAAGGRNQPRLKRLSAGQAAKRRQRHREIARALLCLPGRRHVEAPLGRAPEGAGIAIEPPRAIYVGSWRPATEGSDKWMFVVGRDQAVATFVQVLEEQAERLGVRVVHVDEAFTTMTCSDCGAEREGQVPHGVLRWECVSCGATHDKYHNAARVILARGLELDGEDG